MCVVKAIPKNLHLVFDTRKNLIHKISVGIMKGNTAIIYLAVTT